MKRKLWWYQSPPTSWKSLKIWVQAGKNWFCFSYFKTCVVTYILNFCLENSLRVCGFFGVRKITFRCFSSLNFQQFANLSSSIGRIPAFPTAIISDLATRILTPVGKRAAGENELLIENKFWLKYRQEKLKTFIDCCIWAKDILKGNKQKNRIKVENIDTTLHWA